MDIALIGKAGSGKDSVAEVLVSEYSYTRLSFGDAVKDAALKIDPNLEFGGYEYVPLSDLLDLFGGWENAKREVPQIRRFLQHFGTTMRGVDPLIWIRAVRRQVYASAYEADSGPFVVTDVRFLNELQELVFDLSFKSVRVLRDGTGSDTHISETELDNVLTDFTLTNNGTLADLRGKVQMLATW